MDLTPLPTAHAGVNEVLRHMLAETAAILGGQLQGMYLSGSLALGDFDARRSDIDLVVATRTGIARGQFQALRRMHTRFNAGSSPWATEVEAAYWPLRALRRHDPAHARHPHIQRGAEEVLRLDDFGPDWVIQRHLLREHGIVLAGPDPRDLIDAVSRDDMRRAMVALMRDWWAPVADDPEAPAHAGSLA